MDIMKQRLAAIAGGNILDVATGDGAFIHFLKHHLHGYSDIIGIDFDERIVRQTQAALADDPAVSIRQMASEQLQFPDDYFDTVCLSNSVHHVAQLEATFQEMLRVLKPGGCLLINEMFCDEQNERQLTFVGLHHWRAEIDRLRGIPHGYTAPKQELLDRFQQLDLKDAEYFEHRNPLFDQNVNLEKFAAWHRGYPEPIRALPEYAAYTERGTALIQRIFDVGVEFPTQLLYLGKKPLN